MDLIKKKILDKRKLIKDAKLSFCSSKIIFDVNDLSLFLKKHMFDPFYFLDYLYFQINSSNDCTLGTLCFARFRGSFCSYVRGRNVKPTRSSHFSSRSGVPSACAVLGIFNASETAAVGGRAPLTAGVRVSPFRVISKIFMSPDL